MCIFVTLFNSTATKQRQMCQSTKLNRFLCNGNTKLSLNTRSIEKGYADLLHPMSGLKVGVITGSDCSHGRRLSEREAGK